MRLQELGYRIRKARIARERTQLDLAHAASLSRTTINRLENGLFPDIGVRKAQAILDELGLELHVRSARWRPDYVLMARNSASASFREKLSELELLRALIGGRIAPRRRPHLRALLEEAPIAVLKGLLAEVGKWAQRERVADNVRTLSDALGTAKRTRTWLKT